MPREQFQRQIGVLQDGVLEMGSMVERAIDRSIQALLDRDTDAARSVIEDDKDINSIGFHLQNSCISLLAQQAPMAGDLRMIVSVTAIMSDLERIADRATNIAERTVYSVTGMLPQMDVSSY